MKQLVQEEFRKREFRMQRLRDILARWQRRQKQIEELVLDSFQAQDINQIASLLTEKRWLERRIEGLSNFLEKQMANG